MTTTSAKVVLSLETTGFESGAKRAQRAIAAVGKAGEVSAGQIRAATRSLPSQFTDIITSLQTGQNPFTVLLQQGGQIRDQFGSIGAALRGIAGFITPVGVAITGVVAGLTAFGAAAYQGIANARELSNTILLTGNAAGLTADRMDALVQSVVGTSRQTVGEARAILIALAQTGQTSASVIESQGRAVARIADLSNKSGAELAAGFASQLEAPTRFAARINETYNFLSVAEFKRIQALEQQKKNADAAILTNDLLTRSLSKQREEVNLLALALPAATQLWSQFWSAATNLVRPDTIADRIAAIRKELDQLTSKGEPAPGTLAGSGRVARLRENLNALLREQVRQVDAATARSGEAASVRAEIDRIVEQNKQTPGKPPNPLGAIRSAREQYRSDFLRSEKKFYEDLAEQDRKIRELAEKDPLGAFIVDAENAAAKRDEARLVRAEEFLADLRDANARAAAELLRDEEQRGLMLIEIDRRIAERRIRNEGLSGAALAGAIAEVNRRAELAQQTLDTGIADRLKQAADATADRLTESISNGILDGFRQGGNFAKVFLTELKAQFAKTVLAPILRPTIEAGNQVLGSLLQGIAGLFGVASGSVTGGSGLRIPGRADGGPVLSGQTYLVGERGPELLRMGAMGGYVTPASGAITIHNAPNIHIEARTDAAQTMQLVATGMVQAQRQLLEDLRKRGIL
jgi:phage-related minor tail protein